MAHWFRLLVGRPWCQDVHVRDHLAPIARQVHGCPQLVLLRFVVAAPSSFYPESTLTGSFTVGQILATGVAIPLGRITSDWSWRTCLYLQCAPAVINVMFILFIVESPRWLYAHGRAEEATAILARYHSKDGNVESPLVRLQVAEIEESISINGADRQFWNFKALFNSRSNRYRFGLCAMISCWGQLAGNGMITCKYHNFFPPHCDYGIGWRC